VANESAEELQGVPDLPLRMADLIGRRVPGALHLGGRLRDDPRKRGNRMRAIVRNLHNVQLVKTARPKGYPDPSWGDG